MPSVNGKMITCDRCGKEKFLKFTGTKELDGGFTKMDEFEELPKDWLYELEFGYLCPDCAQRFKTFITNFFGHKVCPKWKVQTEVKKEEE